MKAQNITIDINRLNDDQLDQLAAMLYETQRNPSTGKAINDRIAFLRGWMSKKAEAAYLKEHC